jgi:preprotein translocase subunit SecE
MTQTSERSPAPSPAGGGRGARRPGIGTRINTYNRQVVAELRKVIWPTRNELVTYTIVSLVFVTAMVALVSLYDFLFTKGVLAVFG